MTPLYTLIASSASFIPVMSSLFVIPTDENSAHSPCHSDEGGIRKLRNGAVTIYESFAVFKNDIAEENDNATLFSHPFSIV